MADRTQWVYERDFNCRGQRENAYIITNGIVSESTTADEYDYWDIDLGMLVSAGVTQGTTLLAFLNNDHNLPADVITDKVNFYGDTPLNRPVIVDEIGVKLLLGAGCNFSQWQLNTCVMFMDQGNMSELDWWGTALIGAGAALAANYQQSNIFTQDWALRWSPDRLYNAASGPPAQPGYIPTGRGPNVVFCRADSDGEKVKYALTRAPYPFLTSNNNGEGVYSFPKDSLIVDPGQVLSIQMHSLVIPPPGFNAAGEAIAASGSIGVVAWIKFRQPMINEPTTILTGRPNMF